MHMTLLLLKYTAQYISIQPLGFLRPLTPLIVEGFPDRCPERQRPQSAPHQCAQAAPERGVVGYCYNIITSLCVSMPHNTFPVSPNIKAVGGHAACSWKGKPDIQVR